MSPIARSLGVVVFCFYALTGPGHSSFSDGFLSFLTARSLLLKRTLAIEKLPSGGIHEGTDGRSYSIYGLAAVLAYVPVLVAGRAAPSILQPTVGDAPLDELRRDEFWAQFTNPALMAVVVGTIFLCATRLGLRETESAALAFATAAGSPLWICARMDGSEALQAVALIGAFYCLLVSATSASSRRIAGGLFLALSLLAKPANIVVIPGFLPLAARGVRKGGSRRLALLAVGLPVAAALTVIAVHNRMRFGAPFEFGLPLHLRHFSNPFLSGATTLIFSPSYGLVFFWPASVLVAAGVPSFLRRFPLATFTISLCFASMLILYSRWELPWGGFWGPRYLVPAVPLLSLFIASWLAARRPFGLRALLAATLLGVSVQSIAVLTSYRHQVMPVWMSVRSPAPLLAPTDPRTAPLRIGLWWLRQTALEHLGESGQADEELRSPPWQQMFPWRRPDEDVPRLARLRGIDCWIAPRSWKMPYFDYWRPPDDRLPIPDDAPLAVLLSATMIVSAIRLRRRLRSARACDSTSDVS